MSIEEYVCAWIEYVKINQNIDLLKNMTKAWKDFSIEEQKEVAKILFQRLGIEWL